MAGKAIFYMGPAGGRESGERSGDRRRFENLTRKIRSSGFPQREAGGDIATLAERVREDLLEVIDRIFPLRNALSPLEAERRAQEAFARTRRRAYVEVPGYLRRLDEHVEGEAPPLVVTGGPGAGKSALLAYWSDRYHREHPDAFIITHYIGATSSGGDHYALLRRIMAEIKARYDLEETVPISAEEIDSALPFWLGYIQREKLVLVILDNGTYASTGNQPTAAQSTDFAGVAKACGITTDDVSSVAELKSALEEAKAVDGPVMIRARINLQGQKTPYFLEDPVVLADTFRRFVAGGAGGAAK